VDLRTATLIAALSASCAAPAQDAAANNAEAIAAGRKAYTSYCVRCHGINLVVSGGAFYDLRTFPHDDKARFVRSVRQGLRAMPAWEGIVKPQEVEALWAYIGSVNGWEPVKP
jgi:mono/diheme cytochrome c family protein